MHLIFDVREATWQPVETPYDWSRRHQPMVDDQALVGTRACAWLSTAAVRARSSGACELLAANVTSSAGAASAWPSGAGRLPATATDWGSTPYRGRITRQSAALLGWRGRRLAACHDAGERCERDEQS